MDDGSVFRSLTKTGRELWLRPQALEEHAKGFTRLILFDQLEAMCVKRSKNEKILAIELLTPQGAFIIRGYEKMEQIFAILSRNKPAQVIIELEEVSIDWQSPMAWVATGLCVGLGLLLILWLAGYF